MYDCMYVKVQTNPIQLNLSLTTKEGDRIVSTYQEKALIWLDLANPSFSISCIVDEI